MAHSTCKDRHLHAVDVKLADIAASVVAPMRVWSKLSFVAGMTRCWGTAALFAVLFAPTQGAAQMLIPSPPLAPDIAALPRLNGDGVGFSDINALLDMLDARDLDALNCYGSAAPDGPFRTVEVLSDGPEFLSFQIDNSTYCEGAAHPWWHRKIVNIDLATGQETDLRAFLPRSFMPSGEPVDPLVVLFLNTVAELPGECVSAYGWALQNGYVQLNLGLVEAKGALMLWPDGLAYADTPCLDAALVPSAKLKEAGFDGRLMQALVPE